MNEPIILTIGTFDGVHRAHQKVLRALVDESKKAELPSVVLTFNNVPKDVITGGFTPMLLDPSMKYNKIKKMGVDHIITLDFTEEIRTMTQQQFLKKFNLTPKMLVVGYDFHFGKDQKDINANYVVKRIDPLYKDGLIISSSRIRKLLHSANIVKANQLLGYTYCIDDRVVHGKKIGRDLGFPTINFILREPCALHHGVYSSRVQLANKIYKSISYVGKKPTFGDNQLVLETFIFNFNGDLYGEQVTTYLMEFIREDLEFSSKEELINQIQKDIEKSKNEKRRIQR